MDTVGRRIRARGAASSGPRPPDRGRRVSYATCLALLTAASPTGVTARPAVVVAGAGQVYQPFAPALHVAGGMRLRHESLSGQFQPDKGGADYGSVYRASVAAELRFPSVTFGGELLDSRVLDVDEGGGFEAGDVNALEPVQAYVQVQAGSTAWTAGRFFQNIGSRRLIARSVSGNAPTNFLGVRGEWIGEDGRRLTALYVAPNLRRPDEREAALDNKVELDGHTHDRRIEGVFYTDHPVYGGFRGDLYLLRFTDVDGGDRATRDRRLTVSGARLYRDPAPGALDGELELIRQTGTGRASANPLDVRDLEVSANAVHAEIGWSQSDSWRTRLSFAVDYGSGDRDPNDDRLNRFEGLFGSNRGDFGPGGLYGALNRSNIVSPTFRLEARPSERWDGYVTVRSLWLAQARDSFGNTDRRDPAGMSGRYAGQQVEGRIRHRLRPGLTLEVGGAWLNPQGFLRRSPGAGQGGDVLYGYTDLTASF